MFVKLAGNTRLPSTGDDGLHGGRLRLCLDGEFFRLSDRSIDGLRRCREPHVAMLAIRLSHFFIIAFLRLSVRRPKAATCCACSPGRTIGLFVQAGSRVPGLVRGARRRRTCCCWGGRLLWEAWVAHRQGIRAGRFVLWAWSPALILLTLWVFALQTGCRAPRWISAVGFGRLPAGCGAGVGLARRQRPLAPRT